MPRYFIEVSYKGSRYSGFQVQKNANSIQAEVEKCLGIFYKSTIDLTGSSRTDAGVHALQNYFHADYEGVIDSSNIYHLNAILPQDIVIKRIIPVNDKAHCRFDAVSRTYLYRLYSSKDPFMEDRAYYFPYRLDIGFLQHAAELIMHYSDFTTFSKRNTQVNNFNCTIYESSWVEEGNILSYRVSGNRFLRGMVRGLVGTMLRVGNGKITLEDFKNIIESRDCGRADFSVPAHGLFLEEVEYKDFEPRLHRDTELHSGTSV